jgi:hypothetical protein
MKYDLAAALQALKPGAQWVLRGSEYSGLEWMDQVQTQPTEAELNAKIAELEAIEPMRLLRIERDKRIAAVDWEVTKAYSKGEAVSTELSTYMQALRDLPDTATPTLDATGQLDSASVVWPTR